MPRSNETPTPPFVAWSLAAECVYREEAEANDPARVERVLRPLRAAADALAETRCLDDVCVHADVHSEGSIDNALGFVLSDTLIPFGGCDTAEQTCGSCWANVASTQSDKPRWAGCHGLVIAHDLERLHAIIGTSWYTLWNASPLTADMLARHASVWEGFPDDGSVVSGVSAFHSAIRVCMEQAPADRAALHFAAYPPGVRSGRHWYVPAHCRVCSAVRDETSTRCDACGSVDAPEPARRRMARGQRPYWPIARFLGEAGARALLKTYLAR